jgi:hypothetical protein
MMFFSLAAHELIPFRQVHGLDFDCWQPAFTQRSHMA